MDLFKLPINGSIYSHSIFSRSRDLVSYGVWSGLNLCTLDGWIENFSSDEERYFAANVLDNLIYRSNEQTVALIKQLFHRVIPDYARTNGLKSNLGSISRVLGDGSVDLGVRFVPVMPEDGSPAKSGPSMARVLRRNSGIPNKWILNAKDIFREIGGTNVFVLFDDFLGTGAQVSQFFSETGLEAILDQACFIYTPLVAHVEGIQSLREKYPQLHVAAVELLSDKHAFFDGEGSLFADGVNTSEAAKLFYCEFLHKRGIPIQGDDRFGFGGRQLLYAFESAVPDNSLPILWWSEQGWRPLFKR